MGTTPTKVQRDTILLSHANPEDNEFTQWLALQLANEGYKVWCDLTKLLGGEVFWDDIEAVIRQSAVKVLYILSRTSNAKDGPLRELHLAQGLAKREKLKDFIIPLHTDDLPHGDVTIELTRVNSIEFEKSWASGLASLLEKLELDGVPKSASFDRSAVNLWWRTQFSASAGVRREEESYLSNWFPIVTLPTEVYFHSLSRRGIGKVEITESLPYPAYQDGISLVTFADASDFDDRLGMGIYITEESKPFDVARLREETAFGKGLFRLLRMGWEQLVADRDFPVYELASGTKTLYFTKELIPADKAFFTGADGQKTYRSMVGYSTRKNPTTGETKRRFWHFGVQGRPLVHPAFPLAYIIKPHVLFSSDGLTLWESKKRLATARRSQCKDWWNDTWRDRTLAVMTQLADADGIVRVPLGSNRFAEVSSTPCLFSSPLAYTDPQDLLPSAGVEQPLDYGRDADEDDAFEDELEAE